MKFRYNPDKPINPKEWLAMDEGERLDLVRRYHRKKRIRLPNERLHAGIHTIVENQVAMGPEIPVQKTLSRLMNEGLSRHDSIHAIGSILARHMYELIKGNPRSDDLNANYYRELEDLTAATWLNSFSDESNEDKK
jgi:hypothetical protein